MNIAIDATELQGKPTGVGRYLANLLRYWLSTDSDDTFTLYHNSALPVSITAHPRIHTREIPGSLIPIQAAGQQCGLLRALKKDQPEIFFAPAYSMPIFWKGKTVLTIHDISFSARPDWFSTFHGKRMHWLTKASARRADAVITVSDFSRDEVMEHYKVPGEKVQTIYHGIDNSLLDIAPFPEGELRQNYSIYNPFVLIVGSLFERRYISEILDAFTRLKDLPLDLVIAGEDRRRGGGNLQDEIDELSLTNQVKCISWIDDSTLVSLYRMADQVLYLSEYEGFGLPPLEGMLFGKPVIVSNKTALKEIYHNAAHRVETETPEEISSAIRAVFMDKTLRSRLISQGEELVDSLPLAKCASDTLELIKSVARS